MKRLILVLMSHGWAPLVWDSWTRFIQATDERRATSNVNGYSSIWLCYLLSCISVWVIGSAARISAAPAHILSWAKPASCVIIIIHCNLVWADYLSLPWVTGLIFLCWSKTRRKKYRHLNINSVLKFPTSVATENGEVWDLDCFYCLYPTEILIKIFFKEWFYMAKSAKPLTDCLLVFIKSFPKCWLPWQ